MNPLLDLWLPFLRDQSLSVEQTRHRLFVSLGAFFAAPLLVALTYIEIVTLNDWRLWTLQFIGAVVLAAAYLATRTNHYRTWMPRAVFGYLLVIIFAEILMDRGQYTLYFTFIVPIATVFVFGRKEGLLWTVSVLAAVLPLILVRDTFGVSTLSGIGTNFLGTYFVITGFSIGYEMLNSRAVAQYRERNEQLEEERERLVATQQELLASQERFRTFADLSSDLMMEFDADLVVRYASQQMVERFGDLVGLSADDVTEKFGTEGTVFNKLRAQEPITGFSLALPDGKDGTIELIVNAAPVFDDAGNTLYFVASGRDITQLRERERELRNKELELSHAQKLEALGQLTSGVAHDFNNLLAVVSGNLELLADELTSKDARENLNAAERAVDRAAELTGQLLSFSRKQSLEPQFIKVDELFHSMTDMLVRTLGPSITIQHQADEEIWCRADAGQLESALLNLAINARDAMEGSGKLTFAARYEAHTGNSSHDLAPGDYVAISVTDTGCGIDKDFIDRVIEPFFTTKPVGKGTGLGVDSINVVHTRHPTDRWFVA